jgi:chromosome segregation ATPase
LAWEERWRLAESNVTLKAGGKEEAEVPLEVAAGEKARFLKLLQVKEAEVASISNKVSSLAAVMAELEANNSVLLGQNGELGKELEDAKEAVRVVLAQKADVERSFQEFKLEMEAYRVEMEGKLKAKVEELKVLGSKKAEMDARVASLETELALSVTKAEGLEAEVVAKKKELDLLKGKSDKLQSEVAAAEKKHSISAAEVERLKVELSVLVKAKEVASKAFDAEKTEITKELESLKRIVQETHADKEAAEGATREKDAEAGKLRAQLEELHVSMSQLQTSCDELDTKHSRLQSEKNSVQKALAAEKAEAGKLMSKIQTLENSNGKLDSEIGELRVALKEKNGKIEVLTNEAELLQLAVAEAQKRNKGGIWAWVYAATTTMVAAISLIYATRAQ